MQKDSLDTEKCEGVVKIQNDSQDTSIRERRTVKVLGKFRKTLMTHQKESTQLTVFKFQEIFMSTFHSLGSEFANICHFEDCVKFEGFY